MKLATAVRRGLRDLSRAPQDVATAELALTYAKEIDNANLVRAQLVKVLREVEQADQDLHDRLLDLATRIEQVHVLASLGPKLLAALRELGMTPRVREALVKGAADAEPSPLDEYRRRRAERVAGTSAVDTAAT